MEIDVRLKGSLEEMEELFNNGKVLSVRSYDRVIKTDSGNDVFKVRLRLPEDVTYRGKSIQGWISWDENVALLMGVE